MQKAFLFSLSVILSGFLAGSASAQSTITVTQINPVKAIQWMSFENAYKLNKTTPKKIFIDVYTDWCGWCKRMDEKTFSNPVIIDYMSENFYCVKLNAERKDTVTIDSVILINPAPSTVRSVHQLAAALLDGQMSYPSYVFMTAKIERINIIKGFREPKEFEGILHFSGDEAYTKTSLEEYLAGFVGLIK